MSLNFGDQKLGTSSLPVTATVSNLVEDRSRFRSAGLCSPERIVLRKATIAAQLWQRIAPARTCAIQVTFTPKKLGAHSGELEVRSGSTNELVRLPGNGT